MTKNNNWNWTTVLVSQFFNLFYENNILNEIGKKKETICDRNLEKTSKQSKKPPD